MNNQVEQVTYEFLTTMSRSIESGKRKKIATNEIEQYVKKKVGGLEPYRNAGGYQAFAMGIKKCESEQNLSAMASTKTNSRFPPLHVKYWIKGQKMKELFNREKFYFEFGDLFDFKFYREHKNKLTWQECIKIKRIYQFLKTKDCSEEKIVREERSLMLFYDLDTGGIEPEKYLSSNKGKNFLKRLGLEIKDLHCTVKKELYKYWKQPDKDFGVVGEVIIVEGQSTYYSFIEMLETGKWSFGLLPEVIIFGGGKRILSSFESTEDLFESRKNMHIRYFGDLDPEGYSIYCQLKNRYEDYNINLAVECYRFMYEKAAQFEVKILTDQVMDRHSFNAFCEELESNIPGITEMLEKLWKKKTRIAQEAMNLLTIKKEWGD